MLDSRSSLVSPSAAVSSLPSRPLRLRLSPLDLGSAAPARLRFCVRPVPDARAPFPVPLVFCGRWMTWRRVFEPAMRSCSRAAGHADQTKAFIIEALLSFAYAQHGWHTSPSRILCRRGAMSPRSGKAPLRAATKPCIAARLRPTRSGKTQTRDTAFQEDLWCRTCSVQKRIKAARVLLAKSRPLRSKPGDGVPHLRHSHVVSRDDGHVRVLEHIEFHAISKAIEAAAAAPASQVRSA